MRCPKYQNIGTRTFSGTPSHYTNSLMVEGAHLYCYFFVLLTQRRRVLLMRDTADKTYWVVFSIRGDKRAVVHIRQKCC